LCFFFAAAAVVVSVAAANVNKRLKKLFSIKSKNNI